MESFVSLSQPGLLHVQVRALMWLRARKINQVNSFLVKQWQSLIANFLVHPLHCWQCVWLGHVPGTEKSPSSTQPPHRGHQALHGGLDRSVMGKGRFQNTIQTQELRPPFGASLGALMPPTATRHRSLPQRGELRGPGCFLLPQTTVPAGWGLAHLSTDLDISPVWP